MFFVHLILDFTATQAPFIKPRLTNSSVLAIPCSRAVSISSSDRLPTEVVTSMPFRSVSGSILSANCLSTSAVLMNVALAIDVAAASAIAARFANTVAAEATPLVKLLPPRPLVQIPPTPSS